MKTMHSCECGLVLKVKSDAVKNNIAQEPGMLGLRNQSKLDVVKQEMTRVNIYILEINGKLNSDDHYIYYCQQESLRRNGIALTVNKRIQKGMLGCNLKMTE